MNYKRIKIEVPTNKGIKVLEKVYGQRYYSMDMTKIYDAELDKILSPDDVVKALNNG